MSARWGLGGALTRTGLDRRRVPRRPLRVPVKGRELPDSNSVSAATVAVFNANRGLPIVQSSGVPHARVGQTRISPESPEIAGSTMPVNVTPSTRQSAVSYNRYRDENS